MYQSYRVALSKTLFKSPAFTYSLALAGAYALFPDTLYAYTKTEGVGSMFETIYKFINGEAGPIVMGSGVVASMGYGVYQQSIKSPIIGVSTAVLYMLCRTWMESAYAYIQ